MEENLLKLFHLNLIIITLLKMDFTFFQTQQFSDWTRVCCEYKLLYKIHLCKVRYFAVWEDTLMKKILLWPYTVTKYLHFLNCLDNFCYILIDSHCQT